MIKVGEHNDLEILRQVEFGMYLGDDEGNDILLPNKYIPENSFVGETINVFVYRDSSDRIIATNINPKAKVGQFALLKVSDVAPMGAFLDWGLEKDLLVPFREQKDRMQINRWYMVYVYLDEETDRVVASAKLDKFLDNIPPEYELNQEVDLLIAHQTDLGYKAIINNLHWGILYKNELFKPINVGEKLKGYIKFIREDEKIDLSLQLPGYEKIDGIAQGILDVLKSHDGFLPVNDKSSPEVIKNQFQESKKNFKKAIGSLYKQKIIDISSEGIRIV